MTKLDLQHPDVSYRPCPFWSWNDRLDPEELRRQIREMHRQGIGGFFMHARGGLQTVYLSDEWMACVRACCDEAGRLGMNAWLYDENGWPSGFGGGLVNGLGEHFQQKYLRFEVTDAAQARQADHTIAFYSEDGSVLLGRGLPADVTGPVMRAYYLVNRYYVDNLDPKVVAEFIRVTHQHYYDHLPQELLAHMRGIFTDEPQLSRNGLLWSLVLEDAYQREYGRDLLPELPALAYDLPGAPAVRVRFWRLCAKMFRDNFMGQIRDWCDAHGWLLTGHHVLEESCHGQLVCNGAIMPQYQHYHIPGIDHLGRSLPNCILMTQVVSVAAQFGQRQILTESFALTGWNCNFTGQRFIFQPELAHGVNWLCQHLEGYTLRGLRKRDYPSSASYHQPWWDDYHVINDLFTRVGMVLAGGRQRTETLVIHPQSSVWMRFAGSEGRPGLAHYTNVLNRLTTLLDAALIPHHYADELICEEHARCRAGRIEIGECAYRAVVIPAVLNLSRSVYGLLRDFTEAGGKVWRIRNAQAADAPFSLDGEPADEAATAWFAALPEVADEAAAVAEVAALFPARVRLTENGAPCTEMLAARREVDDLDGRGGQVHYLVNRRYQEGAMVHVSLPATGPQVELIDERTGAFRLVPGVQARDGRLEFDYYFGAADSALFFVPNSPLALRPASMVRQLAVAPALRRIPADMTLAACDDNLLTLDRCRYRVEGGEWQSCDIISLQSRLIVLKRDVDVELEIPFQVADDLDLATPLTLVVETPQLFTMALNGVPFPNTDTGYKFDSAFRTVPLPPALRVGENVLSLSLRYHQEAALYGKLEAARQFETEYNMLTFDTELESVYLMGRFGVRHTGETEELPREAMRCNGSFALCAPALGRTVDAGDLLLSAGLPFFAGSATLEAHVTLTADEAASATALRFRPQGANSWKVAVNGQPAGERFWEPYLVEVAGLLHEGDNTITFTLTTSLRNLLGPHHLAEGESYAVVTTSFNIEPNFVGRPAPANVPGYCLVRHGLADIELVAR